MSVQICIRYAKHHNKQARQKNIMQSISVIRSNHKKNSTSTQDEGKDYVLLMTMTNSINAIETIEEIRQKHRLCLHQFSIVLSFPFITITGKKSGAIKKYTESGFQEILASPPPKIEIRNDGCQIQERIILSVKDIKGILRVIAEKANVPPENVIFK